jgi:hypothetical protein
MGAVPRGGDEAMTLDDEKEIAEAVLRTRRWTFRDALPEIMGAVRRAMARHEKRHDEHRQGADRMIHDYREIICRRE